MKLPIGPYGTQAKGGQNLEPTTKRPADPVGSGGRARKLKVYGWQSSRGGVGQVRCIVAATSLKEVAALAGYNRPTQMFNLCETGNHLEIEVAMSEPGQMFYTPCSIYNKQYQRMDRDR